MGSVRSTGVVGSISGPAFSCALPLEEVKNPKLTFGLAIPASLQDLTFTTIEEIQSAGGFYGNESRQDYERVRNQRAFSS